MSIFAGILIILIAIALIICYVKNVELNNKKIIIICTSIIALIIFLCFRMNIPDDFDIYTYISQIQYYSNFSLIESLKVSIKETNFVWILFLRLISLISNNYKVIYLISIPLTVIPYIYILLSLKKKNKINNREIIICFFFFFAIINPEHLISGIRNAMSVSLFALGMYMELFNNNKKGYFLYITAFFIHPMVIIFLFFRIMYSFLKNKIDNIKLFSICILFWKAFAYIIYYLIKAIYSIIPNNFLYLFFNKLGVELNQKLALDYRILVFDLLQIIVLVIILLINIRKNKNIDKKYYLFYYICIFIVGSFSMFNIFIRTRFILAFFIPFLLKNDQIKNKSISYLEHALLVISICINIYYYYFMYCNATFI